MKEKLIPPLIVITGPTASGKTSLAIELAAKYDGEIVCADSRTIYKNMNIGTAKPTKKERSKVQHHLLDIIAPGEKFSLSDFQSLAHSVILDIKKRGKIPFLVGGTGLYIDSVVLNYELHAPPSNLRSELTNCTIDELQMMIKKRHITMPENYKNKRYLIRAIEQNGINTSKKELPDSNTYVVAISTKKEEISNRIERRIDEIFTAGIVKEAAALGEKYGWDNEAMTGNIYPIVHQMLLGNISEPEAKQLAIVKDRQLVKKQLTWLRRHKFIHWLTLQEAKNSISLVIDEYYNNCSVLR